MNVYATLAIVGLGPALLSAIFFLIEKLTKFKNLSYASRQIIYGFSFGALAIFGTHYGVPVNGAQLNVRDASVLTAGLLFGSPAGIVSGVIAGVERYIASDLWDIGTYTQLACTLSTICAGIFGAFLRKYMFDDKRPSWGLAFAIGLIAEIFHMSMIFFTNMQDTAHAVQVVESATIPMTLTNALSVLLSAIVAQLLEGKEEKSKLPKISQTIQRWLLLTVAVAFLLTSIFMFSLQTSIANRQAKTYLFLTCNDVIQDIKTASDKNLLSLTKVVAQQAKTKSIQEISYIYDITEINIVDKSGTIVESTNPDFVGFDMTSGKQSAEFLTLLEWDEYYVQSYGPISYNQDLQRKYAGVRTDDGFIQVGYDAKHFQRDIQEEVEIAALNRHVGETGYVLIADKDCWIVSNPDGHDVYYLESFGFDRTNIPGEVYKAYIDGEDCLYMFMKTEGYYVVSVMPQAEAYSLRNTALYANSFMEVLVFALLFAMIYALVKHVVVDNIVEVNTVLRKITKGQLDEVVDVRSNLEFSYLSNDINTTVDTLKRYIAEAESRIDTELQYAKDIQYSALIHNFPNHNKYSLYALMDAAKEVGGDFYDFYMTDTDHLNFVIADVSGKGIPGAMFMMRAKTELRSHTEAKYPVEEVLTKGNDHLCQGNDAEMFVTCWEGCLDLINGNVDYANAGHNPPVLIHKDGTCEFIKNKSDLVLAAMEGIQYHRQSFTMEQGDILFLYTDGVVEATNGNKVLFGEDRLIEAIKSTNIESMEQLCNSVHNKIDEFVGDNEQFDDITMLAIKFEDKDNLIIHD